MAVILRDFTEFGSFVGHAITSNFLKLDPYCLQQKCSPKIRFWRYNYDLWRYSKILLRTSSKLDAQLSQRDRAAGCVSYGPKWKGELGDNRPYLRLTLKGVMSLMSLMGLSSITVTIASNRIQ